MPQSTVVIVGGGASGLSAAGALEWRGIKTVILEEDDQLGGTGFSTGLNELLETKDVLNDSDEPVDLSGEPTGRPGIFFIGYTHSLRGHLFEANLASRRLARNVECYLQRTV